MAAFRAAVELGFRHLETDVHTTADGVLLLFHDETLERVTDGRGRISELTAETVGRARIGGVEPIPLFEELATAFPDVRLNLDIKADNGVLLIPPAALVINSDDERGVYLPIDLDNPPTAEQAAGMVQRLMLGGNAW